MIASTGFSWSSPISAPFSSLGMPGIMPRRLPSGPIFLSGLHLLEEVVEGELAFHHLLGRGLGLVLLEGLLGLLDQA